MNLEPNRRVEHEQVIRLLQAAQEPPADSDTPDLPGDVLESLRGQYGWAQRRAIVEDKPGFWERLSCFFFQPSFAYAMALLLLCGVAAVVLQSPETEIELMRGSNPTQEAIPSYWLQSELAEPAPKGLGLPKFIVLKTSDSATIPGNALVFDPSIREARAIKDGQVAAKISITDPVDNDEWLAAHRQLSKLPSP